MLAPLGPATSTAASTPPARWTTSTVSARWNSRTGCAISRPPTPCGTPFASERVKTCRSGSHTCEASPRRPAISRRFGKALEQLAEICEPDESLLSYCVTLKPADSLTAAHDKFIGLPGGAHGY